MPTTSLSADSTPSTAATRLETRSNQTTASEVSLSNTRRCQCPMHTVLKTEDRLEAESPAALVHFADDTRELWCPSCVTANVFFSLRDDFDLLPPETVVVGRVCKGNLQQAGIAHEFLARLGTITEVDYGILDEDEKFRTEIVNNAGPHQINRDWNPTEYLAELSRFHEQNCRPREQSLVGTASRSEGLSTSSSTNTPVRPKQSSVVSSAMLTTTNDVCPSQSGSNIAVAQADIASKDTAPTSKASNAATKSDFAGFGVALRGHWPT